MDITPQTAHIELTPLAAQAIQALMEERQLSGYALRVFIAGQSCCGYQYGMALDNQIRENDTVFESQGVQLVVDDVTLPLLQGANIDYVDGPQGTGFAIYNPNESSSCACGQSPGESGCGCGSH